MNNGYVLSVPKYESINTTMVYYYVKRVFDILISLIGYLSCDSILFSLLSSTIL